jgi:hypothetical protein
MQPGVGYTFTSSSQGHNLNIIEQWSPLTPVIESLGHPFKIVNVSIVGSAVRYRVESGNVNNIVPVIDDVASGTKVKLDRSSGGLPNPPTGELTSTSFDATTKTSYIVMRAGPDATTSVFPSSDVTSNRYPLIVGSNAAVPTDTDTWGFVIIGSISVDSITAPTTLSVNQYVTGSLWGDRIKLGTLTARYYYARI